MRDRRLDFWRGLCLIDMVLVHLVHEGVEFGALAPLIVDYTRFAAGGFVFVAGLGVGLVFLIRVEGRRPASRDSTAALWRRAVYLLGVHYALTGVLVALDVSRGLRPPVDVPLTLVRDIALLREAADYVDVLPLYVAMLFLTPALLAVLRRGLWPLVAAFSLAVFAYGRHDPQAFSPSGSVEFPFLLWQAFFVAGMLFSLVVARLDVGRRAWPLAMAGSWFAFTVLSVLAYGPRFGLFPEPSFLTFAKVPLTTGELLRYLATILVVLTTSTVGWRSIRHSTAAAAVATLGRQSLVVYGAHVFVQMLVVIAAIPLWSAGGVQGLLVVPAVAALWLVARGTDHWEARYHPWTGMQRMLKSWGAPPVGLMATGLLVALVRPAAGPVDDHSSFGVANAPTCWSCAGKTLARPSLVHRRGDRVAADCCSSTSLARNADDGIAEIFRKGVVRRGAPRDGKMPSALATAVR